MRRFYSALLDISCAQNLRVQVPLNIDRSAVGQFGVLWNNSDQMQPALEQPALRPIPINQRLRCFIFLGRMPIDDRPQNFLYPAEELCIILDLVVDLSRSFV